MIGNASETHDNSQAHSGRIQPDFVLENHGSIFLLKPLTLLATSWVDGHFDEDNGFQPYFPIIVIEHGFIADILDGILSDGLAVQS